ncbi:MAG: acetoacetate decarboxylase family protein [Candidatus Bathyarchaeia archaeon]
MKVKYKNTKDDFVKALSDHEPHFKGMNRLAVYYDISYDILREYLPPPLEPGDTPEVELMFFDTPPQGVVREPAEVIGMLPRGHREFAIFLSAKYKEYRGYYCPYMYVAWDDHMASGREIHGFPKKIANLRLDRFKDEVWASAERGGIELVSVKAKLTQRLPAGEMPKPIPHFALKFLPEIGGKVGFVGKPQIVMTQGKAKLNGELWNGTAEITFKESDYDPVYELKPAGKIKRVVFATDLDYSFKGQVIAECKPEDIYPFVCFRYR